MAVLSDVVAHKLGYDHAKGYIKKGKVRVNGVTCPFDTPLRYLDIIEFAGNRLCFVAPNFLIEDASEHGY